MVALLDAGADPNLATTLRGTTALHWAAATGRAACVPVLVKAGADVNAGDQAGDTPLLVALSTMPFGDERRAMVAALLQAAANPNAMDQTGYTALGAAAGNGYLEMVDALVAQGARSTAWGAQAKNPRWHWRRCFTAAARKRKARRSVP